MKNQSMSIRNCVTCALTLLLCLFVWTPDCRAQTDENAEQPQIQLFQLRFADVEQVTNILGTILEGSDLRVTFDAKQKSIVAFGSADVLEKVELLLKTLDVENKRVTRTELMPIGGKNAEGVVETINDLLGPKSGKIQEGVRIAVLPEMNSIALTGDPDGIETVKRMIAAITAQTAASVSNEEPVSCMVRISWLVDPTRLKERDFLDEPGKSLEGLVAALSDQESFNSGKVITSTQTVVQIKTDRGLSDGRFTTSSLRSHNGNNGLGQVSLVAEGTIAGSSGDKLLLELTMVVRDRENPVSLKTTLTLPKNHPVAFSFSDVGTYKSAFVVEVVDAR